MSFEKCILNITATLLRARDMTTLHKQSCSLKRRHNGRDGVSNHQSHHCLLNWLFSHSSKKKIKAPRPWPLCGEFTGDRWIPRIKGQKRARKMFPFGHVVMCYCLNSNRIRETHLGPVFSNMALIRSCPVKCEIKLHPFPNFKGCTV